MTADFQALVSRHYALDRMGNQQPLRLLLQPVDHFYHQNIEALAILAEHVHEQSNLPVCRLLMNREGSLRTVFGSQPEVLTLLPDGPKESRNLGGDLATFHLLTRGLDPRSFPEAEGYQRTDGLAASLDALENKYDAIGREGAKSDFERLFFQSFPYFSGCGENAVQYLVDCDLDHAREPLVVTHFRFAGRASLYPENPATWVADERSRDLAEWLRLLVWTRDGGEVIDAAQEALDAYEAVFPLTTACAARLIGRLLFPLSYVECCERYLFGSEYEDRSLLTDVMSVNEQKTETYEQILTWLALRYSQLDVPEWLMRPRRTAVL